MRNTKTKQLLERLDFTWSKDSIRFINTPSALSRQLFFYVQEVGYFKTSPPYFTERENLNSFLIIYTLSGKGILKYHGSTFHLLPGSTAFIHCIDHHYYECLSGQNWEFLWLHFNGTSALGYYNEFIKNGFHVLLNLEPFFMESTMRRILSLTQKKSIHSETIVSSLIVEILTQLLIQNSNQNLMPGFIPSYLKDALKEIEKHFQEPINLDYLSNKCNVSKYHLSREFKKYIGTPINEYLILTRLNHAKELLKYSNLTIEEIAFSCGFHQATHFINLFKKREKLTPLRYRKEWGNS